MVSQVSSDFEAYLTTRRRLVEDRLAEYLSGKDPDVLWESMRYSVLSGGKRLRAMLCLASAEAVSGPDAADEVVLPCACAIELVHAMSLIHDDLPALDNDDLRRGRPTNHKIFGEAMALLAGDALLTMATQIIIEHCKDFVDPKTLLSVVLELSRAIGPHGMVGGQVQDIALTGAWQAPDTARMDPGTLKQMHSRKTGALIRFATWSGAKLMGGNSKHLDGLARYGEVLGLAFQITDDLLDVTGDAASLGKTPGKDEASNKLTWVSFFGVEKSRQQLSELKRQAQEALSGTGIRPTRLMPLESLLDYAIERVS
jgi:geranylgeranyl diphosphate synthase, type II